jgi:hypothetical protein
MNKCYNSVIESKILNANQGEPAYLDSPNDSYKLHTVNNETGILLNIKVNKIHFQDQFQLKTIQFIKMNWRSNYINKQTNCIECTRNVNIKYLSPGHIKLYQEQ